jgi:quercetin dioxygenase-like cupin family protein
MPMRNPAVPFTKTYWSSVPETLHPGESGIARWRTIEAGAQRVRMVRYSPNYRAEHWCSKGHVVLVLEGELLTETKDGKAYVLSAGQSFVVSDGLSPHRATSDSGALLFVVD